MQTIEIRVSRSLMGLGALLGLGMTFLAFLVLFSAQLEAREVMVLGSAIFLFGGASVFLGALAVRMKPVMVISDAGITDNRSKVGPIPWSDVEGAFIWGAFLWKCVGFKLRNPERYLGNVHPFWQVVRSGNQAIGAGELSIGLALTNCSARQVCDAVNRQVALHRSGRFR